jgi:hypothetical protein
MYTRTPESEPLDISAGTNLEDAKSLIPEQAGPSLDEQLDAAPADTPPTGVVVAPAPEYSRYVPARSYHTGRCATRAALTGAQTSAEQFVLAAFKTPRSKDL